MTSFHYPSRFDPFEVRRGALPHWYLDHVLYFVTFRLADSMPRIVLERWSKERERELGEVPSSVLWDRAILREKWLDRGHGSCALAVPEVRSVVEEAIEYSAGKRYTIDAFVVSTNHVHVLVAPLAPWSLRQILQTWKGFTGHEILRRFGDRFPSLRPRVWQRESFDHIVRNAESHEKFHEYIRAHG